MNFIFMSSKCSKTSSPYKSLLNLSDTLNLEKSDKYVNKLVLLVLSKFLLKIINLKCQLQHRIKSLN